MNWWEGLLKMLGLRPVADPPTVTDVGQDREIAAAKRRLAALDSRLDVVSARLARHEKRRNAHS